MAKNLLDGWIEVFKAGKHIDSGGFSIQLWDLKKNPPTALKASINGFSIQLWDLKMRFKLIFSFYL